jgi:hypothetical protein
MPKLRLPAPASVVADYFHLFVNRRAYTLRSKRTHPGDASCAIWMGGSPSCHP